MGIIVLLCEKDDFIERVDRSKPLTKVRQILNRFM